MSTLVTDRFKAQLYATAGIPYYWIVNLPERVIEVMQDPAPLGSPTHYAAKRSYRFDEEIPVVVAGKTVAQLLVSDLLP